MNLQSQIMIYILISLGSFGSHQQILPNKPIANISTTWINNDDSNNFAFSSENMKAILVRPTPTRSLFYACGFFSNGFKSRYQFSVAILIINNLGDFETHVVWSANRNIPVYENATFQLTSDSNMLLSNAESELVWSTNTVGKHVAGMNLTESGNLVLFDVNNSAVWQSFDHPTDTLLPGQRLRPGQKLIACVIEINCRKGLYSYTYNKDEFFLYVGAVVYYHHIRNKSHENGSLLQLGWDGHLRRFHLDVAWKDATDVLEGELSDCQYPLVCGEYGICQNGLCSCPQENYFKETRVRQPNRGCSHINPLDCNASDLHSFVEVMQGNYFTFEMDIYNTDRDTCKKACLTNCSCKAAMFRYGLNSSIGDCYLPTQIYSLMGITDDKLNNYSLSIDLKVQTTPETTPKRYVSSRRNHVLLIIGLMSGALLGVAFVVSFLLMMIHKHDEVEENDLDSLPTVFTRFSYKELKIATCNFSIKIGEGGFGSVFQGSLKDGTQIAVKHLDVISNIDNSFLTHVRSIGNIHHVNLVRLIGYCAEKSRKLLVYEYMANGSLEKWLGDDEGKRFFLDWNHRRNIVIGIAKGLAYLHEDCMHKIIHLDVKPGNIFLDENFNAKLFDFGRSKLLPRDQSKIFITLRGNPGYMAPEWLSSVITEKVDVYSFGVVIMDILCKRKVVDLAENEDPMHLLSVFARKAKENKSLDMVEEFCEDMQSIGKEVIMMMQVAAWCMQNEYSARPSMSYVVKVLEGDVDFDLSHLDYDFISPIICEANRPEGHSSNVSSINFSIRSGPR